MGDYLREGVPALQLVKNTATNPCPSSLGPQDISSCADLTLRCDHIRGRPAGEEGLGHSSASAAREPVGEAGTQLRSRGPQLQRKRSTRGGDESAASTLTPNPRTSEMPCPRLGGLGHREGHFFSCCLETPRAGEPLAPPSFLPASCPQGSQGKTQGREKAELRSGLEPYLPLCVSWNLTTVAGGTRAPKDIHILIPEAVKMLSHTQRDLTGVTRLGILRWELSLDHQVGPRSSQWSSQEDGRARSRGNRRRVRERLPALRMEDGPQASECTLPLEAGKGKKRFSPRASRRNAALLTKEQHFSFYLLLIIMGTATCGY